MFEDLLARLGSALDRQSIPYMIIGGQAVLLYGEPRLTRDIDVTVGIGTDRMGTLLAVVAGLSLKAIPENVEDFVSRTMVLPAVEEASGVRIDFILSFTPYESEALGRARTLAMKGEEVRFASPEDVIIHKVFAGRPRDLEDVRGILLKNPDLDRSYIRHWLKEFDRSAEGGGGSFSRLFEDTLEESLSE